MYTGLLPSNGSPSVMCTYVVGMSLPWITPSDIFQDVCLTGLLPSNGCLCVMCTDVVGMSLPILPSSGYK